MKAAILAYIALWALLIGSILYADRASAEDCDQFAALSAQLMAKKLNGHQIASGETQMENEMRANTSAWALQKRIRPANDIITEFKDVWHYACIAGWYAGEAKN